MFLTNQQINKLAACHVDFKSQGMLDGPSLVNNVEDGCLEVIVPAPVEDLDDGDLDPVTGPQVLSQVVLAKKKGIFSPIACLYNSVSNVYLQYLVKGIPATFLNLPLPSTSSIFPFLFNTFSLINSIHTLHWQALKFPLRTVPAFVARFWSSDLQLPCFTHQVISLVLVA